MENLIDIGGGTLWSCVRGIERGHPVLLLNGGPGCPDYLEPVSKMLEGDFRVIRFEQRGCGRSVCDGRYDLETAVQDMERIRGFYKLSSWAVVGHSWGANLALVYALTYPGRVDSLVYMAGNGIHNDRHWAEEYHRNRDALGETAPDMAHGFNAEVNARGNASLRAFGRAPDFYKRVSRLDVRTLFLMAEHDIRPSWPVEQLCQLMPSARYVCIPAAGHYLWLADGERLQAELLSFLM